MNRTLRNLFGATVLLAAGCGAGLGPIDIAFDMTKDIAVDATGSTYSGIVAVDLSQYPDVQSHKANITALHFQSVDVKVTAINAATNKATAVSGSVALRPSGGTGSTD